MRSWNTSERPWQSTNTIGGIQNKYINNNWEENGNNNNNNEKVSTQEPNNATHTEGRTNKDKPSVGNIVVPYVQGLGKTARRSAADMGYRHTSREVPPSSNCWSGLRIRTPRTAKVMSFTVTNVRRCTAMKNTYGKLPEPWGKGTKNI